jgi:DNA-binding CsgD family transcriptional regulator
MKQAQESQSVKRVARFDAAIAAFTIRFKKELDSAWNGAMLATVPQLRGAAAPENKHDIFVQCFVNAADAIAAVVHDYFPKLLGIAVAHPKRIGGGSPIDWTCARIRAELADFLRVDQRLLQSGEANSRDDNTTLLADNDRVDMDTRGILYCIGCSSPGLTWWADSDYLYAWRLGFPPPTLNPELAEQPFAPSTGDDGERMSEADTDAWVRKRVRTICDRLARQLANECLDATIMAGRIVGRKPMEAPANPRTLGPKKHDLSQHLDPVDALTDRQRECLSLRFEYGLRPAEIARRLGIHHTTVYEHIAAGKKILDNARSNSRPGKSRPSRYTTAADED